MTLMEAIGAQTGWVAIWMNIMAVALILPVALLFWRQSRVAGIVMLVATVAASLAVGAIYDALGYVRLMGAGHIFWLPAVIYMGLQARRADMPNAPKWIMWFVVVIISISLVFDTVDTIRYALGERAPTFESN